MIDSKQGADATKSFYTLHAEEYARTTQAIVLDKVWNAFCRCLKPGSRVLDLGCGGGRDLKYLSAKGYRVVGVDYSYPLAQTAHRYSGQDVVVADLRSLSFRRESFDGIWALASLLHLSRKEVPDVLNDLSRLLRVPGVLLTSMRRGHGRETATDGRVFELYQPSEWERLLHEAGFKVSERQESHEERPSGSGSREIAWFVMVCRRGFGC
jgi:SAM-dependent methyltransferase